MEEVVEEEVSEDIVDGACTDDGGSDIQAVIRQGGRAQGGLGSIAVCFYNMEKTDIGHAPQARADPKRGLTAPRPT